MDSVNGGRKHGSNVQSSVLEHVPPSNRPTAPPANVQFLIPVWGGHFVRTFLEYSLPTMLAPGNIPAIAQRLPCKFIILTSEEDRAYVSVHSSFRRLSSICATEIRLIDHLITDSNYSTTITLA
jgi:hypothetical protein